jgi:two-component sensor histidine kinase
MRDTDFPIRDERGQVLLGGIGEDITEHKRDQERMKVLVAELQHRVRNILFVIRSVFSRTVETGGTVEDIAEHFRGRLEALSRTQIVLTQSTGGTVDLENLIREELLSVGAGDGANVVLEGPDVALDGAAAEAIGLAVHELTTNSVKYGALHFPAAKLIVAWSVNLHYGEAPHLMFSWVEQGVPAVSVSPDRQGFGTELITRALPYRLRAETSLEFGPGGVRCMIALPLPEAAGSGSPPGKS